MLPGDTRLVFHTHDTAGTGIICYQAAIEAGIDQIDLSLAPCSGGTCQPDVASMWHALRGTGYSLDLDIEKVMAAEEVFKDCMKDYFMPPEAKAVEPLIPWSPMPGGALTANTQMMRDNQIMDRYPEVIKAMGEVVRRGGFGTSVTPVSQFYFQQAFNNVMFGKWEKFAEGYGKMVLGYFGKTPGPTRSGDRPARLGEDGSLSLPPRTRSSSTKPTREKGLGAARKPRSRPKGWIRMRRTCSSPRPAARRASTSSRAKPPSGSVRRSRAQGQSSSSSESGSGGEAFTVQLGSGDTFAVRFRCRGESHRQRPDLRRQRCRGHFRRRQGDRDCWCQHADGR